MKFSELYILSFAAMLLVSCSGNPSESASTADTTGVINRSSPATEDTVNTSQNTDGSVIRDTRTSSRGAQNAREAVFGYSFFKNMREHETRNINAYVSIINGISKVIDTLKDINASDIPVRKNDTATVLARNIFVFKSLTVSLVNAGDSDFIIKSFAEPHQLIDSVNGNSWTWAVTPRTSRAFGRLVMNVTAERPDGTREPFNTINIPITITLDKAINRTIWEWMMDNPEKVLTLILIPLIIFFWKQIVGLFKRKGASGQ